MAQMRRWRAAMAEALFGPVGFYRRGGAPGRHFRTAVTAGPSLSVALRRLAISVDDALGRPAPFDVVDMGAGDGELLAGLLAIGVPARWRLTAVEVAPRPERLPTPIRWRAAMPAAVTGLLFANEWLDTVPVDVVEQTPAGPRLVLVGPGGQEALGAAPEPADLAWLTRWWPLSTGNRAEVGRPRDVAWAAVVARVERGLAIAVDYEHERSARPPGGTLTGYRAGRVVAPVPDGSCDITAAVALDSAAAAATTSGRVTGTCRCAQRVALRSLGVDGRRPALELASSDPTGYLHALAAAGAAAELTDPDGLGGFGWLVQSVGIPLPAPWATVADAAQARPSTHPR